VALTVGALVATFDLDPAPGLAGIATAEAGLHSLGATAAEVGAADPTVHAHADTSAATRGLAQVAAEAEAVDHLDVRVDVRVDDHGGVRGMRSSLGSLASSAWSAVTSAAGFLKWPVMIGAGVPMAAALAGALVNIAPAAGIAAAGVLSLVSAVAAIKIGTGGIGSALKAAFAPAVSGGGGAAKAANGAADAQRNLQRATENAAWSNKQAVQQTASAERDLVAAQKAALAAQKAVNDARKQATRDLEDMNNSLTDAQNGEKDAAFAVQDALDKLNADKASAGAVTAEQMARDQLAYDEAVQALKEQQLQVSRLTSDTAAANKAGVDGSKGVTDAKSAEAQAVQDVQDKTLALSNAQEQQARTAQAGADAILQAKEALAQAGAAGGGGAAGVDAFAAAMAKLAPNARAFVREVISLGPAWKALQLDVQQRLFAGLAGALAATAAVGLPVLQRGLDDSAGALNRMGLGVLGAARALAADGTLGKALKGASAGLSNLSHIPGLIVTAFGQVAAAAAPQFDKLTAVLGDKAQTLADKLSAAFTSGGMASAIDMAVGLIKQIGSVLRDVGSVVSSVMKAAGDAGGGWLGVLKDISSALKTAFASPEVQAGLSALFNTMAVLGQTLAPLVVQALGVIAPVLAALGPPVQTLVRALGAALQPIIKALGPILLAAAQAVGALVTSLSPLLPVIGDLIAAILPILTPVLRALGTIFGKLAGPIRQIATALGTALQPVIEGLTTVVDDLVTQYLASFLTILGQLLPVIPMMTPVLIQLGISLGQILDAVAPLLPQLMMLSVTMITQLLPAILPLIPPLAQLTTLLLILATDVITKVVVPTLSGLIKFLGGIQRALQPAMDAIKWLTTGIAGLFEWLYDHLVGHSVIPDMVRAIVSWLAGLPGKAMAALASLPGALAGVAQRAAARMTGAVRDGVATAVWWVGTLPARAVAAVGSLGGVLYGAGQSLLKGFIDGIRYMIGSVKDVLGGITDSLTSWKGPPGRDATILRPAGRLVIGGFMAGIADQVPALRSQLGGLTADLPGMGLAGVGGYTGAPAGAGGGQQTVHVVVDVQGGNDAFTRAVREVVKVRGGGGPNSVQRAFGG
jgi:phage-related protein